MMLHVSLHFLCLFIIPALTLKCKNCPFAGNCFSPVNCSFSCSSSTTTTYLNGIKVQNASSLSCGDAFSCLNGSMNTGQIQMTFNSKCCSSNLCNTQTPPDLPRGPPNGRKCFFCTDGTDCSKVLNCQGVENKCFSSTENILGITITTKGCLSSSLCSVNGTNTTGPTGPSNATAGWYCCDGNLCNGGQIIQLYFLTLAPLLFLFLFLNQESKH